MITNALIRFIQITLEILLGGIPAIGLPTILTSTWATFMNYLGYADSFIPMATLFQVIGVLLVLESGFLLGKVVKFIINIARGSGV